MPLATFSGVLRVSHYMIDRLIAYGVPAMLRNALRMFVQFVERPAIHRVLCLMSFGLLPIIDWLRARRWGKVVLVALAINEIRALFMIREIWNVILA